MPFKIKPPFYYVWQSMKDRCLNPRSKAFPDYGGRGIRVCERWQKSYADFAADMGPRPDGWSIDRIDNDGDYTPDNCRWADKRTQQRNQRRAVYVEVEGTRYRAIELAERHGLKTDTIVSRAARGMTYDQVISPERFRDLSGFSLGGRASGVKQQQKTHCPHGHSYDDAIISKLGHRRCRQCFYAKERARRAARKTATSV